LQTESFIQQTIVFSLLHRELHCLQSQCDPLREEKKKDNSQQQDTNLLGQLWSQTWQAVSFSSA
jgi:hypothetical protein